MLSSHCVWGDTRIAPGVGWPGCHSPAPCLLAVAFTAMSSSPHQMGSQSALAGPSHSEFRNSGNGWADGCHRACNESIACKVKSPSFLGSVLLTCGVGGNCLQGTRFRLLGWKSEMPGTWYSASHSEGSVHASFFHFTKLESFSNSQTPM